MADLHANPLEPFGFEVQLRSLGDIDAATATQLREIFARDGLLVVRGLQLSHPEQIEFCRHFGPVPDSPFENFVISNVDEGGHLGKREIHWHNDIVFLPSPYLAACLHAVHVDPDVVGTRFVSGYRGYDRLPQELKDRIAGLKALQVRERVYDRPTRLTDLRAGDICTVHDVVRTDPASGRKFLFVNQAWTAQIIGMSEAESDALLAEIYSHFYVDEEVHEHRWRNGDLVLWDNIRLQHSRGLAGQGRRTLQRVTITPLSYPQMYPTDTAIYDELHNDAMLGAQAA